MPKKSKRGAALAADGTKFLNESIYKVLFLISPRGFRIFRWIEKVKMDFNEFEKIFIIWWILCESLRLGEMVLNYIFLEWLFTVNHCEINPYRLGWGAMHTIPKCLNWSRKKNKFTPKLFHRLLSSDAFGFSPKNFDISSYQFVPSFDAAFCLKSTWYISLSVIFSSMSCPVPSRPDLWDFRKFALRTSISSSLFLLSFD